MQALLVKWTVTVVSSAVLSLLAANGSGVASRLVKADEPETVDGNVFDACENTDAIARVPAPYDDGEQMTGGAHINPRPSVVRFDYDDAKRSDEAPFCSHAVCSAYRLGGQVDPVPRKPDHLVTPNDLTRSMLFDYAYTLTSDSAEGQP